MLIAHGGVAPDGTRILPEAAVVEMQTNQIEGAEYAFAAAHRMAAKTPYGLGEWLDSVDADGRGIVVPSDGSFGFRPWTDRVHLIEDRGSGFVEADTGMLFRTHSPWGHRELDVSQPANSTDDPPCRVPFWRELAAGGRRRSALCVRYGTRPHRQRLMSGELPDQTRMIADASLRR